MTTARDQAAALLEQMGQRDIRQLAEYCIDHLNDTAQHKELADYLRLQIVLCATQRKRTEP